MKEKNEEVRRIIELPDTLANRGGDPFVINVGELLEYVKQTKGEKAERLKLEAEALNSISKVVKSQEDWVIEALRGMKIDPELVRQKLQAMQIKDIANLLSMDIYPCLGIRRMSRTRIRSALDYFSLIEPWGRVPRLGLIERRNQEKAGLMLEELNVEREAEKLFNEIRDKLDRAPIDYNSIVLATDNPLLTAYCLAYLSSTNKIIIKKEPLESEIYIMKPEGGAPLVSVAIALSNQTGDKKF